MDFPNASVMPTHISTVSRYTNSPIRIMSDSTTTWVTAAGVGSLQWMVPLILPSPYLIASFFVCFGSSPGTGVFECGIYTAPTNSNAYMNKVCGTASTACVNTTSNVQIVTPSGGSKWLSAGNYYMAYVSSGTNAIISKALSSSTLVQGARASGILLGPTATTLAANHTATQLSTASTYKLPLFGVSRIASGY